MKKIILAMLVIVMGTFVYADEPVPVLRPASPDVPSEIPDSDGNYKPNVIRTHEDVKYTETKESEVEQIPSENDGEYEYVEVDENGNETPIEKPDETKVQVEQEKDEKQPESYNPINTDATNDNAKNITPVNDVKTDVENTTKKEKVKKEKAKKTKTEKTEKPPKEKPKKPDFSKYKDAETDPYVQSIFEEKTEEQKRAEEEAAKPKTYTQDDYQQMYRDMPVPTFSFIHGVDPDQYYDMKDTTWSPYPLFRLKSPLYFKTITIEPGYYLLTPRKYKDDWYILFKEAGAVKYIIPAISRDFTPANYYRDNLPELDMKKTQRWQIKFLNAWGKYIRKSKRRPAIQTNLELTDLDNNFLLMDVYYGAHKYSCIFRVEKF